MKREDAKLCWHCGRRFHGNKKTEVGITAPNSGPETRRSVFVHKQCAEDMSRMPWEDPLVPDAQDDEEVTT